MKFSWTLIFFFLTVSLQSQEDSLIVPRHQHLKANISHSSFNVILNRVNRHILPSGKDWADVGWDSWKENLGKLPSWDWDLYTTNWFAHPYQGAMYYNAARSLKMNYFTSMSYAITGTAMWEYFGEDLPPSSNDFITNILGGIYLGEVMFRLSENILDDRARGGQRRTKEILGALINPMGGMNRLFYCELGKHYEVRNHLKGNIDAHLYAGNITMLSTSRTSNQDVIPLLGYHLTYGSLEEGRHNYSPFDLFWLNTWIRFDNYDNSNEGFQVAKPVFNFSSSALIHGRNLNSRFAGIKLYGLFQDYEYLNTYTYKFGLLSFCLGAIQEFEIGKSRLMARSEFGIAVLGAVESTSIDWVRPDNQGDERDYVMGHGMAFKSYLDWKSTLFDMSVHYDLWYLPVASGPEGEETVQRLALQIKKPVSRRLMPAVLINYYKRKGVYESIDDPVVLKDHNLELMVLIGLKF